jgi:hypothetical protein
MDAVGYRGIAFTTTGKALLLLGNGSWLTLTAAQGEDLVRGRAEEGLRSIPVIDPPAVLPTRDPLRHGGGPVSHTNVELPPSAITEPLVLWGGSGASLTLERVIPYPNGIEIELRTQGLLIEDAEMPWGRASRGFWHFRGLQLAVSFADGRSQRIEDLTAEDREGPLTISPFRRHGSRRETLWLWVMPSPPDGPVRLLATWHSHRIAQATVEFAVGSR